MGVLGRVERGDVRRRSTVAQPLGHAPHGAVDVVKERLVAGAQVVQARLAVRCVDEAILGAAAMAGEADVALAAEGWEPVALVQAELPLPLRADQVEHVGVVDVAEPVPRFHEVVTAVEIAGVLQREREATRLRMDAKPGWLTVPVGERDVEHLHEHLADVAAHPLLEDVDQKPAILLGGDRAAGDAVAVLHV